MESFTTTNTRRPCFVGEDDGLASLAEMKAGFSGNNNNNNNNNYPLVSRPLYYTALSRRTSSLRNLASFHARYEEQYHHQQQQQQPHFLDACFLCKKPLGDKDIFMYRGDTPFCSEECRQEQIDMDESKEKSWNLSASMKALRKKDQRKSSSPNKTTQDCRFRTGAVAAA